MKTSALWRRLVASSSRLSKRALCSLTSCGLTDKKSLYLRWSSSIIRFRAIYKALCSICFNMILWRFGVLSSLFFSIKLGPKISSFLRRGIFSSCTWLAAACCAKSCFRLSSCYRAVSVGVLTITVQSSPVSDSRLR